MIRPTGAIASNGLATFRRDTWIDPQSPRGQERRADPTSGERACPIRNGTMRAVRLSPPRLRAVSRCQDRDCSTQNRPSRPRLERAIHALAQPRVRSPLVPSGRHSVMRSIRRVTHDPTSRGQSRTQVRAFKPAIVMSRGAEACSRIGRVRSTGCASTECAGSTGQFYPDRLCYRRTGWSERSERRECACPLRCSNPLFQSTVLEERSDRMCRSDARPDGRVRRQGRMAGCSRRNVPVQSSAAISRLRRATPLGRLRVSGAYASSVFSSNSVRPTRPPARCTLSVRSPGSLLLSIISSAEIQPFEYSDQR